MEYGLLGRQLKHSYSPELHAMLADYDYRLYCVEPEDLPAFMKEPWEGLNVTIPYKKAVIEYCDELGETAKLCGAVNTLIRRKGRVIGENTDYYGFCALLESAAIEVKGKKLLVLGSGGAGSMVTAAAVKLGAKPVTISRSGESNYSNLERHSDAEIIVNATPVGMYPGVLEKPLDLSGFPKLEAVVDLIYNPLRTALIMEAEKLGLKTATGLEMLAFQAAASAMLWTGAEIPFESQKACAKRLAFEKENIALIGMPGCGKSQVGRRLAARLGRPFVDLDAEIQKTAGKSPSDIITEQGEDAFRAIETRVCARVAAESGQVISCGGGIVTRPENYPLLHSNSRIIWLKRELYKLPSAGRPLSGKKSPQTLWAERKGLYREFADFTVDNNKGFGAVLASIEEVLKK